MADSVTTRLIGETPKHYIVHLSSVSDGTGEAAVAKVDKSTLVASDGAEPASLDIEKIIWNCDGMTVALLWDHSADDVALRLGGNGQADFRGADLDIVPSNCCLKDPRSAGGTGDILLTTTGHSNGDSYNVTLFLRKQAD